MAKKRKKKTINISFGPNDWKKRKKEVESYAGGALTNELNKAVNKAIKEIRHHFKEDSWDLSYDLMKQQIIETVLGPVSWFVMAKIVGKGFKIVYLTKEKEFVIRKGK